jgi:hypothetical protein
MDNSKEQPMEKIICSAIYISDGKQHTDQPTNIETGFVISGRRHNNCYAVLKSLLGKEGMERILNDVKQTRDDQGFITSMNRYVNRKEAMVIAKRENQLLVPKLHQDNEDSILTSEDLFPMDWGSFKY